MKPSIIQLASEAVRATNALSKSLEADHDHALFYTTNKALRHLWFVQGTLAARQRTKARSKTKAAHIS